MSVDKNELIIEPLKKAYAKFLEFYAISDASSDFDRAAVIKAFEFCYELSWKTLRKVLLASGHDIGASTAKDLYREAAIRGLIQDPEIWFKFIEKRNLTMQIYREEVSIVVYACMNEFKEEVTKLMLNCMKVLGVRHCEI